MTWIHWFALAALLTMLGLVLYGLYLSACAAHEEAEADKKRASQIAARPWEYEEEAPEPQAGFGGVEWKEAGARLRRQPKV